MLVVETIARIRRAYFVQGKTIKAICRELRVSRKVVRKVIRSSATAFEYERRVQPQPKLGPWRGELEKLPVPDHTTLARRRRRVSVETNAPGRRGPVDLVLDSTGLKFHGPGEWDRLKHGEKRRAWRKLHLAVDTGMAGSLVVRAGGRIRSVIADGAYDGAPVDAAIRAARPPRSPPKIVVPPSAPSIPTRGGAHGGSERESHAAEI